jgi:hypothetical protein
VIRLIPPPELVRPCKVDDPRPIDATVRDLIESRQRYREALAECDARMGALRDWRNGG